MGNFSCYYGEKQDPNTELPTMNSKYDQNSSKRDKFKKEGDNTTYVMTSANSGNETNYNVKYKRRTDSTFSQNSNMYIKIDDGNVK